MKKLMSSLNLPSQLTTVILDLLSLTGVFLGSIPCTADESQLYLPE